MSLFRKHGKQDRDTQRSFLLGERSLRAYLAGGNVRFLKDAETNLSMIGPEARQYEYARFYLGITKAQLRKASESIEILTKLQETVSTEREGSSDVDFADKIALQLAYAHIKTYTDTGYEAAEEVLNGLVSSASSKNSGELLLQAKSLQAFLYSVMAGYSTLELQQPDFARKARTIGEEVLNNPRSSAGVRFEALNALGITWMRIAGKGWDGSGDREASWAKAQRCFDQALLIVPNSVRVLQNMATLRLIQVQQKFPKGRSVLLAEAKQLVKRSLEVNDQDQFPFYQLAQIAIEERDQESAMNFIREGRSRPGAVKEEAWAKVESAAEEL
jgi:hypothetical protein